MNPLSLLPRRPLLALALLLPCLASWAQAPAAAPVQVEDAWVRASVPGQKATGAFMRIRATEGVTLLGGASTAAGHVEVHEMKMEGDVMRMRPLAELPIPAGQAVELRSGGLHLMFQDLKAPLQAGSVVPVTLHFRDARGSERRLPLQLPVRLSAANPAHARH